MKEEEHLNAGEPAHELPQTETTYFSFFALMAFALLLTITITFPTTLRGTFLLLKSYWFIRNFFIQSYFSFLVIFLIQCITIRLDKKHSWRANFKKRLLMQFILGGVLPLLLYFFVFYIFTVFKILPRIFPGRQLIMAVFLLNAIYGVHYGLMVYKAALNVVDDLPEIPLETVEAQPEMPEEQSSGTYNIPFGLGFTPTAYEDIAYFWREGNHVYMQHLDGNQSVVRESLDTINKTQQNDFFFPITRDYLTAKKSILGVKVNRKRGFTIELNNGKRLDMCRKKTKQFEDWYGPIRKRSLIKAAQILKGENTNT